MINLSFVMEIVVYWSWKVVWNFFLENILGIFEARVCSHLIPWNLNKNLSMFKWLNEYVWKGIKFLEVGINFGNFWSIVWLFELGFELMEDVFNEVVIYECLLRVV